MNVLRVQGPLDHTKVGKKWDRMAHALGITIIIII